MDALQNVLNILDQEIAKLREVKAQVESIISARPQSDSAPKRRSMSSASRQQISQRMKKHWATKRAAAEASQPKKRRARRRQVTEG